MVVNRSRLLGPRVLLIVAAAVLALAASPAQATRWKNNFARWENNANWFNNKPTLGKSADFDMAGGGSPNPQIQDGCADADHITFTTASWVIDTDGTPAILRVDSAGDAFLSTIGNNVIGATVSVSVLNSTDFNVTGGSLTFDGSVNATTNTITKEGGGSLRFKSTFNAGALDITAGDVQLLASNIVDNSVPVQVAGGTFDLNEYNETVASIAGAGNILLGASGGEKLTVNGSATTEFSGSMSESGGFEKAGAGTLTLSGANSYTGATTVSAGTLLVTGSLDSAVTVTGGVFGGGGQVNNLTLTGGTHAPGTSPGIDTVDNYNLGASATLEIEIDGTTVGTQYDQVDVTGTVDLAGTLDVVLGYAPEVGDAFMIIDNDAVDAVSGTFSGLAEGGTFSETYDSTDYEFKVYYAANNVGGLGDGNDVVLEVIPEPSILVVIGAGALTLLARRKRRRQQA